MDERELKDFLKKQGINDTEGHIRIHPETGEVQKWGLLGWESKGHTRIHPETGEVQKRGLLGWESKGHTRIHPETGEVQKRGLLGWESKGHTRIHPETGEVQKRGLLGWESAGHTRIHPQTGEVQKWGLLGWPRTVLPTPKTPGGTKGLGSGGGIKGGTSVIYTGTAGSGVGWLLAPLLWIVASYGGFFLGTSLITEPYSSWKTIVGLIIMVLSLPGALAGTPILLGLALFFLGIAGIIGLIELVAEHLF